MKIKEQYKVREMAGEHVIIMQGKHGSDLTKIISLNQSALYLWNELQGKEFDTEAVADMLVALRHRQGCCNYRCGALDRETPRV